MYTSVYIAPRSPNVKAPTVTALAPPACRSTASASGVKAPPAACSTRPGARRSGAATPLRARTMTRLAGAASAPRAGPGHRGNTTISPARSPSAANTASRRSARWMSVTLPLGRTIATQNRSQSSIPAAPSTRAALLAASGGGWPRPAGRYGGLAMTWSKVPAASRAGGRNRSPAMNSTRPARPLSPALPTARRTRSGATSTPQTRTSATRIARHSAAAPAPAPTSRPVSPAAAGTAAARKTGSMAAR